MPTYENPNTGVVHWISLDACWPAKTACGTLDQVPPAVEQGCRNWVDVDTMGVPADVTCSRCRATSAFADDEEAMEDE